MTNSLLESLALCGVEAILLANYGLFCIKMPVGFIPVSMLGKLSRHTTDVRAKWNFLESVNIHTAFFRRHKILAACFFTLQEFSHLINHSCSECGESKYKATATLKSSLGAKMQGDRSYSYATCHCGVS